MRGAPHVALPTTRPIREVGENPTLKTHLEHGVLPAWERVWRDGVDITDTVPPELWPWPSSMYYELGWRPIIALDGTRMP